ncbi:hypothetical protein ACOSQ2_024160 [Xanthoceras sorbifolium]
MGNSFVQLEVEGNASLTELKQLSRLTSLDYIHVLNAQIMPQDLLTFEKLEIDNIFIGNTLLNTTEGLCLDELKGFKNVVYQLNGEVSYS